jgi:hypothetical protein
MSAVRTIYSSTMSEKALRYREERGLLDRDEQMSLLVQRVSGSLHNSLFYPHLAGVGFSHNSYVWSEGIDPEAGVMRLVFGLGTRAVDRSDDDYTRLVALNAPSKRPEGVFDSVAQFAQRKVDVLGLNVNQLVSLDFAEVAEQSPDLPLGKFSSRDPRLERYAKERAIENAFPWVLTLEGVTGETRFVEDIRGMLQALHEAYEYPVDVEFTANFLQDGSYLVNLLQCRPLQVQGGGVITEPPADLSEERIVARAEGAVIGQSRLTEIRRVVYVVPEAYGNLPIRERYTIARLVGRVVQHESSADGKPMMLLGPGRWGTTTPSLGVPVSFAEINRVSVLCEIVAMREDVVPDVSYGTHFFNDIVEAQILYMALFPERDGNSINSEFLEKAPNRLRELLPNCPPEHEEVVRVIDIDEAARERALLVNANSLKQRVICYLEDGTAGEAKNRKRTTRKG